jgi:hypothetical protein
MNAKEIEKCIECLGGRVLSLNQLDGLVVTGDTYLVVNTSSDLPGTHWTAFHVRLDKDLKKNVNYFDPLALGPTLKSHVDFCNANCEKSLTFNNRRVQSPSSMTCGLFCILFCHHMATGSSFENFMNSFGPNLHENDARVREIFIRLPAIKEGGQSCRALQQLSPR